MKTDRMTPKDLPEVVNLAAQLGYPNSLEEIRSRFESLQRSEGYCLLVAKTESGKVVGYIQINREPHTLLTSARAEVSALVIGENERGKGIGTALLKTAEAWAQENNLNLIRIRSNVTRNDAHRFYQKQGYVIQKSWHVFIKDIEGKNK